MFRRDGFTLIELVMVITILGILALVAIPKFIDLRGEADFAKAQGIKAAGEAGAQIWHAKYLTGNDTAGYPTEYPSVSNDCFEEIPDVSGFVVIYDSTTGRFTIDKLGSASCG